jgi:L-threonylcarbamoyladenylate synthase
MTTEFFWRLPLGTDGPQLTTDKHNRGNPQYRPGHIAPAHLEAVLGCRPLIETADGAPRVSGSLVAHYAPQTPMRLISSERLLDFINAQRHKGDTCGVISHNQPPQAGMPHVWRMLPADPTGYAHDLYAALRDMDHAGVSLIAVESLPGSPDWAAVADRLRRAVAGAGQP